MIEDLTHKLTCGDAALYGAAAANDDDNLILYVSHFDNEDEAVAMEEVTYSDTVYNLVEKACKRASKMQVAWVIICGISAAEQVFLMSSRS